MQIALVWHSDTWMAGLTSSSLQGRHGSDT